MFNKLLEYLELLDSEGELFLQIPDILCELDDYKLRLQKFITILKRYGYKVEFNPKKTIAKVSINLLYVCYTSRMTRSNYFIESQKFSELEDFLVDNGIIIPSKKLATVFYGTSRDYIGSLHKGPNGFRNGYNLLKDCAEIIGTYEDFPSMLIERFNDNHEAFWKKYSKYRGILPISIIEDQRKVLIQFRKLSEQ